MLNGINHCCKDYYDQIPANSLRAIGLSAVTSFTATLCFPKTDLSRPFLAAGIVGLAATIHAITAPIFNYIFDNKGVYNPYQEFAHILFNTTLTQILFNRVTPFNINLLNNDLVSFSNRYGMMTSSLIRIIADITLRALNYFEPLGSADARLELQNLGINFSQTTPIYFTVY